jgi:hypothetical protein
VSGPAQVPQFRVPPQPSPTVPQFFPCTAHVDGVQPHTWETPPPPQVCGAVQLPQFTELRRLPQLSGPLTDPQFFPSRAQNCDADSDVHPHTFG